MTAELAPTLGPQVAHFINTNGVHGPGEKIGEPFELSFEELGFIYQAYELVEDPYRPGRWRRRYRHGIYCRRKGLRKSELMGEITLAEFDGPVVIHGVQHIFHTPVTLKRWPSEDRRSRIVVITRDIDESALRGTLRAFTNAGIDVESVNGESEVRR